MLKKTMKPWPVWIVAVLFLAACGSDDSPSEPDSELSALVGDWEATTLELTNTANPAVVVDLIEQGATFTLNVQPSGQYTAILIFSQQAQTEIGQLTVSGATVTLQPEYPSGLPPTTATYTLEGGRLTLDGDTEFDFNLDGTPEAARSHIVLVRQ
ncbi:MAG: hypothetical protein ACE5GJ_07615 [Gemmatimonadota bacterium]